MLRTGGAIWLTNVIVFSLWYWLFDRGGPYARAQPDDPLPDVHVPADGRHDLAPAELAPRVRRLPLPRRSPTRLAFSPTDVMPLTQWAKLTMLLQSLVSLMIAVLVIARAVNILH